MHTAFFKRSLLINRLTPSCHLIIFFLHMLVRSIIFLLFSTKVGPVVQPVQTCFKILYLNPICPINQIFDFPCCAYTYPMLSSRVPYRDPPLTVCPVLFCCTIRLSKVLMYSASLPGPLKAKHNSCDKNG